MAKKKLSRDQKRKQKKRKIQQRKRRQGGSSKKMPLKVIKQSEEETKQHIAIATAKYQVQEERIMQVFGVNDEEEIPSVDEAMLQIYARYLKVHIQLPCLLAGIESIGYFGWEERFQFGYGSKAEHDRMRKEFGSLKDQFLLEEFNSTLKTVGWSLDIVVTVKRSGDGKRFEIPLSELEATDENSDNAILLNDFTVWKVNW